jgi:hypothetical protein
MWELYVLTDDDLLGRLIVKPWGTLLATPESDTATETREL